MEVVADTLADRPNGVEQEAGTVLERAAVLVVAVVDRRREELREDVAVGAVDLDAVQAGFLRPPSSLGERLRHLLDLRLRHPLALEPVQRIGLVGRAPAALELDAVDVALAAAERELEDVRAAVLVHAAAELAPERDPLVGLDRGVARER